jgi:hypothetical protein
MKLTDHPDFEDVFRWMLMAVRNSNVLSDDGISIGLVKTGMCDCDKPGGHHAKDCMKSKVGRILGCGYREYCDVVDEREM